MMSQSTNFLRWLGVGAVAATVGCGGGGGGGSGDDPGTGTDTDPTTTTGPATTSDPATSTTTGEGAETTGGEENELGTPDPGGLRRLLSHQYVGSIELFLGSEAAAVAQELVPADPSVGGFDALATVDSVPSATDVERYEAAANAIAQAAVEHPATLAQAAPCLTAGAPDSDCYRDLAREVGRLAWRRPLTTSQIDSLVDVAETARTWDNGSFDTGVRYLLTVLLQSPRFLYMVEVGEPLGGGGGVRVLDGYEMASRLSFFLLGRTADANLMDRAEAGELSTPEQIRDTAWELIERPLARATVARFYDEFLGLTELPLKGKDEELFPLFSPELAQAMRIETELLVLDVVFQRDTNVLELLDADYTFVDDQLSALYGLPEPATSVFHQVQFPPGQDRAGVLSQVGWLAAHAHNNVNSPTRRGLFVAEQLLCIEIDPPPPGVNPQPIEPEEGQTLREALAEHQTNPTCATCHSVTDPLGFAFEGFDAVGAYRTQDNGSDIDASGDVVGFGSFDGAVELAAILRDDPYVPRCLVNQVYTAALGFAPADAQEDALDLLDDTFFATEHNFKELLVELTATAVFRQVDAPK